MKRTGAVLCLLLGYAASLSSATVTGKVSFVTKRGQKPVPAETVVWLEPSQGKHVRRPAGTFTMSTRDKKLTPHVLTVPVGSTVQFPNDDPISHNLFSLAPGNSFDLGLYRKGAGKSQKFDTAGAVRVYCNVHPNMSAVVLVMPMQHYTFADAGGAYTFSDIEPGKYRLAAWNEQGGMRESVIEVLPDGTVRGDVAVAFDIRAYRVAQHLNKEGKAYQPPSLMDAPRPGQPGTPRQDY